jgi:hypothetical protein
LSQFLRKAVSLSLDNPPFSMRLKRDGPPGRDGFSVVEEIW